ncbi:MAG: hypothetical protein L6Q54_04060 [Leptospiraceae bacterium]|nr:hypothetical protein [Leptospiraceae bacterium]MCK6380409.1 hypothetical protein [Leptospiraceae bacterium]NUM41564.1 hypothetical protein [Leptospiraceae bacterium]
MRIAETLYGQLQSHDIARKWQFENPYTTLNQMVEQTKILKEYVEKRNKLAPPVESTGILWKEDRSGKDEPYIRGQKKANSSDLKKYENNSILFYNSEGKGIKSISGKSSFEFFA